MTSLTFVRKKYKMATSNDWNDLPDIALIYVYLDLSDTDRLNVACTCKNWNRLFSTAILWRKRRVVFDANAPETLAENEVKFLDRFGHCLTRLTLNFGRPTFKSCMNISKAAESYLKRMCSRNDIRLRELDLENLHMEQHWHFILSRNRLVTAVCKMIRKQRYLETVFMAGARLRLVDGCRILEALGKAQTRSKIKTLYMEDFFETNMFPSRHPRYVSAMSKFQVLEDIHLNYRYLSSEMIRNIANKQFRSMKTLSVVIEGDVRGVEIPADAWMEFSEKCPLAEVGVYLCTTVLRGNDLRTPFVRGLPLNQIYLTSWSRIDETENRLANLLRHLGNMYNTSLGKHIFSLCYRQVCPLILLQLS
ncbi:F-box only protein 39 [Mactra antiquata]